MGSKKNRGSVYTRWSHLGTFLVNLIDSEILWPCFCIHFRSSQCRGITFVEGKIFHLLESQKVPLHFAEEYDLTVTREFRGIEDIVADNDENRAVVIAKGLTHADALLYHTVNLWMLSTELPLAKMRVSFQNNSQAFFFLWKVFALWHSEKNTFPGCVWMFCMNSIERCATCKPKCSLWEPYLLACMHSKKECPADTNLSLACAFWFGFLTA